MGVSYPSPRTGTAQDLMRVITRAYEGQLERAGTVLPHKSEASRRWLEPAARLAGIGLAGVLRALPADWYVSVHDALYKTLAAGRSYAFDPGAPVLRRAAELAARLE